LACLSMNQRWGPERLCRVGAVRRHHQRPEETAAGQHDSPRHGPAHPTWTSRTGWPASCCSSTAKWTTKSTRTTRCGWSTGSSPPTRARDVDVTAPRRDIAHLVYMRSTSSHVKGSAELAPRSLHCQSREVQSTQMGECSTRSACQLVGARARCSDGSVVAGRIRPARGDRRGGVRRVRRPCGSVTAEKRWRWSR
jgi:hypothetical protein